MHAAPSTFLRVIASPKKILPVRNESSNGSDSETGLTTVIGIKIHKQVLLQEQKYSLD